MSQEIMHLKNLTGICLTLIENDEVMFAIKLLWNFYQIQRLVKAAERHNKKVQERKKKSVRLYNEMQIKLLRISMKDL